MGFTPLHLARHRHGTSEIQAVLERYESQWAKLPLALRRRKERQELERRARLEAHGAGPVGRLGKETPVHLLRQSSDRGMIASKYSVNVVAPTLRDMSMSQYHRGDQSSSSRNVKQLVTGRSTSISEGHRGGGRGSGKIVRFHGLSDLHAAHSDDDNEPQTARARSGYVSYGVHIYRDTTTSLPGGGAGAGAGGGAGAGADFGLADPLLRRQRPNLHVNTADREQRPSAAALESANEILGFAKDGSPPLGSSVTSARSRFRFDHVAEHVAAAAAEERSAQQRGRLLALRTNAASAIRLRQELGSPEPSTLGSSGAASTVALGGLPSDAVLHPSAATEATANGETQDGGDEAVWAVRDADDVFVAPPGHDDSRQARNNTGSSVPGLVSPATTPTHVTVVQPGRHSGSRASLRDTIPDTIPELGEGVTSEQSSSPLVRAMDSVRQGLRKLSSRSIVRHSNDSGNRAAAYAATPADAGPSST